MALDNIPTLGPGGFNGNLDKVLVYKNGGSEVACSLLTLTNSALNIAGVYIDAVNQRVGIGTSAPTTSLTIYGGSDTLGITGPVNQAKSIQIARYNSSDPLNHYIGDDGGNFFGNGLTISSSGSNSQLYLQTASSGRNVNIGSATSATPNIGARLGVRGSGSTSATTSLLVQNSGGTSAFQVKDNLTASVGNGYGGDGIRFEAGNNSAIVFTQGSDRIALVRENSDKLRITARNGFSTYIGEGISTDGGNAYEWKMEGILSTTVAFDTTRYIKVFINGVAYKLAVCV